MIFKGKAATLMAANSRLLLLSFILLVRCPLDTRVFLTARRGEKSAR